MSVSAPAAGVAMTGRRCHVILNARSGAASALGLDAESLARLFAGAGLDATIDADMDRPLAERIADALAGEADIVVSAGGDGTTTAIAAALVDSEKTLAVLPLGTANLLARDLGIPLTLPEAVAALAGFAPLRIDVGEVNGTVFLHKVVIGLIPGLAAGREQLRGREDVGAKFGFLRYVLRRVGRARRFAAEISTSAAGPRIVRAQAVAIANNGYDEGVARIFSRQRLDGGFLSVYVATRFSILDMVRLSAAMLLGRWRSHETLSIEEVEAVTIRSRRKRLKVMLDGEIVGLATPLAFRIRPGALSVLAPAPAGA